MPPFIRRYCTLSLTCLSIMLLVLDSGDAQAQFGGSGFYSNNSQRRWERHRRAYNLAQEEATGKDALFRFEVSYGYIFTSADIKFKFRALQDDVVAADTVANYNAKPAKQAWHGAVNSGRSVSKISEDAALVLGFGISVDNLRWQLPTCTLANRVEEFECSSTTIGIPIFLDYKKGAEAKMDVDKHTMLNAGVGVLPAGTLTVGLNSSLSPAFSLRPAARVEFGVVTKYFNLKVQAMEVMGNIRFVNQDDITRGVNYYEGTSDNYDLRIQGRSQFIISVSMLAMTAIWQNHSGLSF